MIPMNTNIRSLGGKETKEALDSGGVSTGRIRPGFLEGNCGCTAGDDAGSRARANSRVSRLVAGLSATDLEPVQAGINLMLICLHVASN